MNDQEIQTPREIIDQIKESIREAIEELTDKSPNISEIINNVKTLKQEAIDICNETIAECTRMQRETAEQIQAEKQRTDKIKEINEWLEQAERSHKKDPGGIDARTNLFIAIQRVNYAKKEGIITEADTEKINQEIKKNPVHQIMIDIDEIINQPKSSEFIAIMQLIIESRELHDKDQGRQAQQKLNETANEIKEQLESGNITKPQAEKLKKEIAEEIKRQHPEQTNNFSEHINAVKEVKKRESKEFNPYTQNIKDIKKENDHRR